MNVGDVMTRIKRQFGDESGVQVTDADIFRWINDGQRQIVMQNEGLLEKSSLANIVADQQDYSLPADLLILRTVHIKDTVSGAYFKLKGYSFNEFDEYVDGWDGTSIDQGAPTMFTVYESKLKLFPLPQVAVTSGLKIYYNRSPVDIDDSLDSLDLPLLYHETLVKYCLQQAHEMDEDWDAAQTKAVDANADITILRGREGWKNEEVYPRITVLLEDEC